MAVIFAPQWLTNGDDHVTSQATARTLINNASAALESNNHMEIFTWRLAVTSGAPQAVGNFLRVFKGTHQNEGQFQQFVHLTMSLKIQRKTGEYPHASYGGAFHLYVEIIDPVVGAKQYQLKPVHISYVSSQNIRVGYDIANAAMCNSDK
jgi:hypothetical protein